jgi:hypothetical protein
MLQQCKSEQIVMRQNDTFVGSAAEKKYNTKEYALISEKKAKYLIYGYIWKPHKDSSFKMLIKLYQRIDSVNITISTFQHTEDSLLKKRNIELFAQSLISEICPGYKIDQIYQSAKVEEIIDQNRMLLDKYNNLIDSLRKTNLCLPETVTVCKEAEKDTIIKNTITCSIDTNLVNTLVPVYGLCKSFKRKESRIHSTMVNLLEIGTGACGGTFLIMAEQKQYRRDSNRLKAYGTSCLATTALTAIVNGLVVAHKLKHHKEKVSQESDADFKKK